MKTHGPARKFVSAFAIVCVIVGAVCLGLGLSVLNYIRYEQAHSHQVDAVTIRECTTFFAIGAAFCLGGIVVWMLGKRPAV
jgi:hypothetical protein